MTLQAFLNGPALRFWHDWRAALIALLVALAVRAIAELTGRGKVALQAPATGALAGWGVLAYPQAMHWPLNEQGRLMILGAIAVGTGFVGDMLGRAAPALTLLLAVLAGWFVLGAPIDPKAFMAILAQGTILAALCGITILWLRHANAWVVVMAALALWVNLTLAGAAAFWPMIAACIAAASLSLLGRSSTLAPTEGGDEIGIAAIVGFAVIAADLAVGKLRQNGFTIADIACCSPLLIGFVAPRIGRHDIVLGSALSAAGSVALLWAVRTFF